ncbi:MAG: galactokinase [Gemmatimonadetes bacterium]|nr:galactokinase [Gemmatimonadota bacterium]MCC6771986.1 galactokinase [Gemmatimonadaceae bacterium]
MKDRDQLVRMGMSPTQATAKASMLAACDEALDVLGSSAQRWSVWVPGRIELLGKHTDYAGGRSLLCTVERGFAVRVALRTDALIRAVDVTSKSSYVTALDPTADTPEAGWGNYVATVARRLARNFPCARCGVDLAFSSDLPIAAGMSSSSALMIAVFVALAKSNDLRSSEEFRRAIFSREELASYLGTVENGESFRTLEGNVGVGTFGGSQDHTAIMCAESGHVVQYSFSPVRREAAYVLPPTHTFVVGACGVLAEKTAGAREGYNRAALMVRHLLASWNEATGRQDATLADAARSADDARDRLRGVATLAATPDFSGVALGNRLEQFLLESFELIPEAASILARGAIGELGAVVDRSQAAAELWLGNQIPETIALARLARELGADAASSFGAGFGGSVWALVAVGDAEAFSHEWAARYAKAFPGAAARSIFFVSPAGPGANQF